MGLLRAIVAGMADGALSPLYSWQQATDAGLTRAQRQQDGQRATRGAYVSRALPLSLLALCRAAALVLPAEAAFCHRTAAVLWGAPVQHRPPVRLVVPPGVVRPRRVGFRSTQRALPEVEVRVRDGLRLTSPERTWLDLATDLPPAELLVVGDALLRSGHLTREALAALLDGRSGARGVVLARRVAPLLDGGAASRPESLVRWALLDSDLPPPEVQVPVRDQRGVVLGHGDLGYEQWRILLEYEGRQHAEREQFRRDVERYSLFAAAGWLALRFTDAHLGRTHVVVDRVRRALLSRGARW